VPYDGSAPADDMLRLACRICSERGRVVVVYMTRIPSSLPLDPLPAGVDARGDAALDQAEAVAAGFTVRVETWLTRVRKEFDAIVGEARLQEADAIFLPLWPWHHPWRRLRTGHLARQVARRVSCAVLVGTWRQGVLRRTWLGVRDPCL
jgi:nucleotide-binding universal stress UspA family protein